MAEPNAYGADELLEQIGWVRRLANSLVRDPHLAEDLVQQTTLVALTHSPSQDRPLRPWLATVLRNFALRARRGEGRRESRERVAARGESLPSAVELVERAALHKDLVAAVMSLEEPYRTTLLLRYLQEMPPRAIADRQGVPVRTVNTRLQRGLERLRTKLDARHGGDRSSWLSAMIVFAEAEPAPVATTWGLTRGQALAVAGALALLVSIPFVDAALDSAPDIAQPVVEASSRFIDEHPAATPSPARALSAAGSSSTASTLDTLAADRVLASGEGWVAGRVEDPAGRPIPGAEVVARALAGRKMGRFDPPLARQAIELARTTSDERGEFRFGGRIGWPHALVITHPAFAGWRREEVRTGEHLVAVLTRGARLSGRVVRVDSHAAADGARVRVSAAGDAPRETGVDDRGQFAFEGLRAGRTEVEALAEGMLNGRRVVLDLAEGAEQQVRLELVRGDGLRGEVRAARDGTAIGGASIALEPRFERVLQVGADGRFEILGLTPGSEVTLFVRAPGYGLVRRKVKPFAADLPTLTIELSDTRRASGRLIDPQGNAICGAFVAAVADAWRGSEHDFDRRTTESGPDGRFTLVDLRSDLPHEVLIAGAGVAARSFPFPSDEFSRSEVELGDLVLEEGGSIDGVMVDEQGRPLPGLDIHLVDLGPCGMTLAQADRKLLAAGRTFADEITDAQGRFHFEGLASRAWFLGAGRRASATRARMVVDLQPGERRQDVRFELEAKLAIHGRVIEPDGKPVVGIEVIVAREDALESPPAGTSTDQDGRFVIRGLDEGSYSVAVEYGRGMPAGFAPSVLHDVVAGVQDEQRLVLAQAATIRGVVRDRSGEPLPYAVVWGRDEHGLLLPDRFTDAQGRFELDAAPNMRVELHAAASRVVKGFEREVVREDGSVCRLDGVVPGGQDVDLRLP